jgi:hypothetical protein
MLFFEEVARNTSFVPVSDSFISSVSLTIEVPLISILLQHRLLMVCSFFRWPCMGSEAGPGLY